MTTVDLIRKLVPPKIRIAVGVWAIKLASRKWFTLKWFLYLLYGLKPTNMGIIGKEAYYDYKGRRIFAPHTGAGAYLEIFNDEVYEQVWRPQPKDVVIDIGAYVGMFAVKSAVNMNGTGLVVAVEPSDETYQYLKNNCAGLKNVRLVKKAIMAQSGKGKLYYSRAAAANSMVMKYNTYQEVDTITLDEMMEELHLEKADFIKIDAEGAEMDVLKGGTKTLAKGTKLAIAAYHTMANGELEIEHVMNYLKDKGYTIHREKGLRSYLYAEKID